jgi:hypothetical protein
MLHQRVALRDDGDISPPSARKLNPKVTIKWLRARLDVPEVFYEGLRKAGLPEE